jgi:hypothetical protein
VFPFYDGTLRSSCDTIMDFPGFCFYFFIFYFLFIAENDRAEY